MGGRDGGREDGQEGDRWGERMYEDCLLHACVYSISQAPLTEGKMGERGGGEGLTTAQQAPLTRPKKKKNIIDIEIEPQLTPPHPHLT